MIEQLDVGELVSGFQVGRAQRLADWAFRREQQETARLINLARVLKRSREIREEDGDRLAHVRAVRGAWEAKPEERAKQAARRRRRRKAKYDANPMVSCKVCGKSWAKPFRKGRVRRLCSDECKRASRRKAHECP